MNVDGKRGRGRTNKKWLDEIGCDMRIAGVCINYVGDRVKWRFRTQGGQPQIAVIEAR